MNLFRHHAIGLIILIAFGAAPGPATAAESLGRLFFSVEQRAQMDVARSKRIRSTLAEEPSAEDAAPLPEMVTYRGVVQRSDGKNTIWLNNHAIPEGEISGRTPVNSTVRRDGSLLIQLPEASRRIDLKVGQSLEVTSGVISEPFARPPTPPAEKKPAAKPGSESVKPASTEAATPGPDRGTQDEKAVLKAKLDAALEQLERERQAREKNEPAPRR